MTMLLISSGLAMHVKCVPKCTPSFLSPPHGAPLSFIVLTSTLSTCHLAKAVNGTCSKPLSRLLIGLLKPLHHQVLQHAVPLSQKCLSTSRFPLGLTMNLCLLSLAHRTLCLYIAFHQQNAGLQTHCHASSRLGACHH